MNKKIKIFLLILAAVLLAGLSGLIILSFYSFQTPAGQDTMFTIRKGDRTREIAQNLYQEKVIRSPLVFSAFVFIKHWYLQDGVYKITQDMKLKQILEIFHEGRVSEYLVTIPEGWRATQIDEALTARGIIKKGEFSAITTESEGYLFPDTYRFALDVKPEEIKKTMLDNFARRTAGLELSRQDLIIASIVEREAKLDEDRAKIAGVYYARLEIGMALQADPTIQYGKGDWDPITKEDYRSFDSPYNTYLYKGLPPGPICNPGIESIKAVLEPIKDDSFYFFHDSSGKAVFSKTYEEHLAKLKNS